MSVDSGRREIVTRVAFIVAFAAIFAFFSSRITMNYGLKSIPPTVNVGGGIRSPRPSWCDETARDLYIDLLKRSVSNFLYECHPPELNCVSMLKEPIPFSKAGTAGKVDAKSMVGMNGLDQVDDAIRTILAEDVPGDFVETGVFKGGTCIFMLGMLKAMGDVGRLVYVADSFRGIPPVNLGEYAEDKPHAGTDKYLPKDVSMEVVQENFFQFGLLDHTRLRFLKGWFNETLPTTNFDRKVALLRMDGDLFESTWDALANVYPHVSVGGYVIVDDYGDWIGCKKAVDWYREFCGEGAPMARFDAVWPNQEGKFAHWRKSKECPLGVDELNRLRRERQRNGGK
mmetsp:Transcript_15742/g.34333  ORF Transcript_15742/g.34333 Transcript_15742/m.34333 type:complete len:341 (+) Transcript_15742:375-1397(+)